MNREPRTGPGAREVAAAALFFLAATVLMTWPQAVHLSDALADVWDAKLVARILQWDYHQTLTDPARLFELNFFYPAQDVLAFSENLWGVSLFGYPLLAAGASPLLNYNVLFLLGMVLSALGAWALARHVTGDGLASLAAGLVFAFLPWRFSQIPHLQFQWAAFLALSLLFLLRYLERGRPRDAVLLGAAFAWNALCNVHYALFGGILVVLALTLAALQGVGDGRRRRNALFAILLGGLLFLPFALPYHRAEVLYGMKRYTSEMLFFSGRFHDFLSTGFRSRLYGKATAVWNSPEGDFFPGVVAVVLSAIALVRVRRPAESDGPAPLSSRRRAAAHVLDAAIAVVGALWIAALFQPGLRLGGLKAGDAGRVQVILTVLVVARLVVALPGVGRYVTLGDWLRRGPAPPALSLLGAVAITGTLIALGGNTPYYRFLFQSFGRIFRSIRVPARGIVLFDLALAVLAAWGLSALTRRRRGPGRAAGVGAALALLLVEYRAFPLGLYPVEAEAPPVYRWLSTVDLPGAVAEWPLGLEYDFDYVFRQAQHDRPLVNGYSGFFPEPYRSLEATLKRRPIPDSVWRQMRELGAVLVVYHAHETRGIRVAAYAEALERATASGGLEVIRSFPHGGGLDFVFIASGASRDRGLPGAPTDPAAIRKLWNETSVRMRLEGGRLSPPFGNLHRPSETEVVAPGFWAHGWALDDSGIEAVEVAIDGRPEGNAVLGGVWPGLAQTYPEYPESASGAFGFSLPALAPGTHTIVLTLRGRDGGTSRLERRMRVSAASPTPRGPGS